jgi:hypothetical protein
VAPPTTNTEQFLENLSTELGITLPDDVVAFLSQLEQPVAKFGNDEWWFSVADPELTVQALARTRRFRKEWGLDGFVLADNGLGDELVLLPSPGDDSEPPQELGSSVYVLMHEVGELRNFARSVTELGSSGDIYATDSDDCVYRLNDDSVVERGPAYGRAPGEAYERAPDSLDLKRELDGLIDDRRFDRAEYVVEGLSSLTPDDGKHAAWAHHKLSELYRHGFGPIPEDLEKMLAHNAEAVRLEHESALANRAFFHLKGIGVEQNLELAEKLAREANKRSLRFGVGGLFDELVEMIQEAREKG